MSNLTRYHCTHCGRHFEAEAAETVECPGCLWSSSVKPEDFSAPAKKILENSGRESEKSLHFVQRPVLLGLLLVLIGIGLVWFWVSQNRFPARTISADILSPDTEESSLKTDPSLDPYERLPEEDRAVLDRRVDIRAEGALSEAESKILELNASYRTGLVEKLPSPAWTLENFREMIAAQEKFYKMPFPRSYKKKLEALFREKYLPAVEAFAGGNLREARDAWVGSLAFPLYSQDIQKHRGVALTMLRPLITDVLSKIGAINVALVEQEIRVEEQAMSRDYQNLRGLLAEESWQEALEAIEALEQRMNLLEKEHPPVSAAPPYPPDAAFIDAHIGASLQDLLTVQSPAIADLGPIREDLKKKRAVAEGRIPERLRIRTEAYERGIRSMEAGNWQEAADSFRRVDAPPDLAQDARGKIEVLERLIGNSFDSKANRS